MNKIMFKCEFDKNDGTRGKCKKTYSIKKVSKNNVEELEQQFTELCESKDADFYSENWKQEVCINGVLTVVEEMED